MEAGPDGAVSRFENGGDFGRAEVVEIHHETGFVGRGQRRQKAFEQGLVGLSHEAVCDVRQGGVGLAMQSARGFALPGDRDVEGDAVRPGHRAGIGPKSGKRFPDLEQNLLEQVAGLIASV